MFVATLHRPSQRIRALRTLRGYLALTKPRIVELLLITTVPTMVVAERGLPPGWLVLATLLGGALAAGGANAINMIVDRDIDRLMARTSGRPLVVGAIEPAHALIFALVLEVVAAVGLWLLVNPLSAVLTASAAAFYVGIYTLWLKRSSVHNIVIGGAAGAVPVLVGWAAVTGSLGVTSLVLFGIVFAWTPPHFWSLAIRYRDEYANADVPMMPVVCGLRQTARQIAAYTLLLWALSLVLVPVADLHGIYLVAALLLGGAFAWQARRLLSSCSSDLGESPGSATLADEQGAAMRLFKYSISYLAFLFLAMAVDQLVLG